MTSAIRRTGVVIAAAAVLLAGLSGCSMRIPTQESLETAIPKALLAADLGITSAEADTGTDGVESNVVASLEFESAGVTADDLGTILEIIVDNANVTGASNVVITAGVGPLTDGEFIDLGSLGEKLGFSTAGSQAFYADWDDVVAFVND